MLLLYIFGSLIAGARAALTYKGVDWSSVIVEEAAGRTYKNSAGTVQPLETILKTSGVNTVRQRLWVNPSNGNYNLAYNLKLAQRAQVAGLDVYLDMHFSDTWADPGHQAIPSGWPTNIDDLTWRLYNYTLQVGNAFTEASLPSPTLISIGNEITSGLLLPVGSTSSPNNVARLLHSAASGIRDSSLGTKPKILIHLDNGWNWNTQQKWYTSVLGAGPLLSTDFDIMAVSYYPFYSASATLASLKSSLANMASTWKKEIIVAETNWPFSCPSPKYAFPADVNAIPRSAQGQTQFVQDVAGAVQGTAGGAGLFYWEPAWIDNANLGSSCGDNLLVDGGGVVRSSMGVFQGI